jgi:hypothetical protein
VSSVDQGEIFKFSLPGRRYAGLLFRWRALASETIWSCQAKATMLVAGPSQHPTMDSVVEKLDFCLRSF